MSVSVSVPVPVTVPVPVSLLSEPVAVVVAPVVVGPAPVVSPSLDAEPEPPVESVLVVPSPVVLLVVGPAHARAWIRVQIRF